MKYDTEKAFDMGYKDGYHKGYTDGMKTQASHEELCKDELLADIREDIDGIYIGYRHGYEVMADVLAVLDKHISGKENE